MSEASGEESKPRLSKTERLFGLLAYDFTHLGMPEQSVESTSSSQEQIALPFEGSHSGVSRSRRVVGFDEAGRGALAGPVTIACVSFDLPSMRLPSGAFKQVVLETFSELNDSKKVSARIRERLFALIQQEARVGIGCASAQEIDQMGIVPACQSAARRAYRKLGIRADIALFDRGLSLGSGGTAGAFLSESQIAKGDAKSFHIAAASIVAKVSRDALLCLLDTRARAYGFASHKGYGSAAHIEAIRQHGPSRFHRKTFLTRIC